MIHKLTTSLMLVALMLMSTAAFAQTETETATPAADIGDDLYIGTLDGNDGTGADAGMTCASLTFGDGLTVDDVSMDIDITHTWLGDLTVKVQSPAGTVVAPMVRPTGDATNVIGDDGSGCCGDSSDLAGGLNFDDANTTDAETMGFGILGTGVASGPFLGNGDESANSGLFSTFAGEAADGNWEVCIGDGAGGDTGTFDAVTLTITGSGGGADFEITAGPATQTVAPGGVASFTHQVTNNTANTVSGVTFYEVFRGMNRVVGPVQIVSGSLAGNSSTPVVPFSVNVPNSAPAGTYRVDISAGPSLGNAVATASVEAIVAVARVAQNVEMTKAQSEQLTVERPQEVLEAWTLLETAPWSQQEEISAAARTSEVGAYPNPFVDRTEISFTLDSASDVSLVIYDVRGREVANLLSGKVDAGQHDVTFQATDLPSGVYIYRLVTGTQVETGRMTLVQ